MAESTTRGSILHEVLERYLLADEQGIDPNTGKPVDLYPEGWHIKTERGQSKEISFEEQAWIRRIVQDSIDANILWRPPTRVVEYGFEEELLPATDDLPQVIIKGFIDLGFDWTIGDHKSCKNLRWVLNSKKDSSKYIGDDVQLLTYCYYWAKKREREGFQIPETMEVEHYQYPFQDDKQRNGKGIPQKTSTTVTWARIIENYNQLKATADQVRRTKTFSKTYEDSEMNLDSCGAYGGCAFRHLCNKQESIEMYTQRTNYKINPQSISKEKSMSAFDDLLSDVAATDNKTETPAPAPETKTEEPKLHLAGTREELEVKITALETAQAAGIDMSAQIKELQDQIDALDAEEKAKELEKKKQEEKAAAEKAAKEKAQAEAKAKQEAEAESKAYAEQDKSSNSEVSTESSDESETSPSSSDTPSSDQGEAGVVADYQPDLSVKAKRAPSSVILCIKGTVKKYAKYISIQKIFDEYEKSYLSYNPKANVFEVRDAVASQAESIVEKLKGYVIEANVLTADTNPLIAAISEVDSVQLFIGSAA